jgi:hypothetical protein
MTALMISASFFALPAPSQSTSDSVVRKAGRPVPPPTVPMIYAAGGTLRAVRFELFYLDESNTLTSVLVSTSGPTFSAGSPATVFDTKYVQSNPSRHYDVSADGQRFLMIKDGGTGDPNATPASIVVVEHWFEELKARLPAKEP